MKELNTVLSYAMVHQYSFVQKIKINILASKKISKVSLKVQGSL